MQSKAIFIPEGFMWSWLSGQKKKGAIILGYSFFGLLMFFIFFYLTFPFHLLELKLISTLEKESGCKIVVDQKGFYFPSRLSWKGIRGTCPQPAFAQWKIDSLHADLAPLPLLWSRRGEVDFTVGFAGGEMSGHLTAAQKNGNPSFSLETRGKKLNLAQFGLSGLLSLEGTGDWSGQDILKGKGAVSFALETAKFKEIAGWVVPIGEVSFSNVRGKLFWHNGTIGIERFFAEGDEVDLTSEGGNLLLREPLAGSMITLTLKAMPKGSLQKVATVFVQGYSGREPLTLGIKGPLGQPQISLNGKPINQ
jgi:type II secretion system protein N